MSSRHPTTASTASSYGVQSIDHIRKLPDADKARALLEELKRHVDPILKARGWRVLKLYEICCCTSGGKNLSVGGFCQPAGDKVTSLRIAIRLRTPGSGPSADEWGAHTLRDFDHCMKIVIHEISHIVEGAHSARFYALMAELTEQYEKYKKTGLVLDDKNMPIVGGHKADASRHNPASALDGRQRALAAAESRAHTAAVLGGGGRLGGGADSSTASSATWRNATPAEMARRAAEDRQRRWDAENGLEAAELEAMTQSAEADEDEVQIVGESRSSVARETGSSRCEASSSGSISGGSGDGTRSSKSGGAAHPNPKPNPGDGTRTSMSSGAAASGRISWAARGQGSWQQVPCPVCGPICNASLHRPAELPPQDGDEGRRGVASRPGGDSSTAGSGASCGSRGRAVVVDLTGSDDDESAGVAAAAPKRARSAESTGAVAAAAGVAAVAGAHWQCSRCTYAFNARTSAQCEMECGEVSPFHWSCVKCTTLNDKASSGCSACGTWRYSRDHA